MYAHNSYHGYHYTAIMALVDISTNKNSYHRMQLLASDDEKRYGRKLTFPNVFVTSLSSFTSFFRTSSFWIFQKSGRIGTTIGKIDRKEFNCAESAEKQFKAIFKDLTGNDFKPYAPFLKQPEKFQLLDIECEAQKDVLNSLVPTNLKVFKHGLMRLICDEKAMKDTMLSFDLDSANMPLGKFGFIYKKFVYCFSIY